MQIGIVGRQPFQLGGSYQIVVGGDERQTDESGSKILFTGDQGCREVNSIIPTQAVILGQLNGLVENERVRPDQAVFGRTMNRHQIDCIISLPEGNTTRRALTRCDSGSSFYLRELSRDDRIATRRIR